MALPMKDKFETRQLEKHLKKKSDLAKKESLKEGNSEHKSKKFFTKMQDLAKTDSERKLKR